MNPRARHLKHKSYLVNSLIQSNLCNVTVTDQLNQHGITGIMDSFASRQKSKI